MSGCSIGTLSLRLMRGIKHFRVRNASGNVPPASQLLRQLDYIRPNLRFLELARCWVYNSTGPSLNLSFPCLRLLIISSTFVGVTSLVPYLTIPTTTTVRITTYGISDSDFHVLASWVAQCFSGSSSKKRRMEDLELSLGVTGLEGIMLRTWPDSSGERHGCDSPQFYLKLCQLRGPINSQESRIGSLLSVLPLGELQRLTYCFPSNETRSLLRYFQALPNLHTIQSIGTGFLNKTLDALTENRDSGQSSVGSLSPYIPDVSVTFPALRRIVLKSLHFPVGTDTFCPPNLWPDRFAEALRVRAERGAPLSAVVLKQCVGVDMNHIEELRGSNIEVSVVD
ncbi:hypothetical protein V5O48_002632 [Marasmius crinis-equi]|uniref:Uncharacterized protein n=1 Tax=Marasmius crinis-equi TaxID=585013 RepID=A0ABR3FV30_9AGAR